MALSGFLATISIVITNSFVFLIDSNGYVSANEVNCCSYSNHELYSSRLDDFDRFVLDCDISFGFAVRNVDLEEYFLYTPLEIYSLYLPYYSDIYRYDLYFTLDDYSIVDNEITFIWSYDIESFCLNSDGAEYLKSIFTRNLNVIFDLNFLSNYNILDYSRFNEWIVNEISSYSIYIDVSQYFNNLNNLYREGYDKGLSESFQSGYDSGYNEGYDEGFDWGQELGYNQGLSEGSSSSLANPFDIIRSALKGPLDFLMLEIAPNITIGTILLIPLSITILVFLLKGLVK